jgi:excisionase family DNA binding protein
VTGGATVAVTLLIGGQPLIAELDADALGVIADALAGRDAAPASPFLSVPETAAYLRTSRQAVDDLLSAGKLARRKVGRRTLVARADVEQLVQTDPRRAR